jgi:predicted SnoaL-like aldol condensation-catalyzing enzyme
VKYLWSLTAALCLSTAVFAQLPVELAKNQQQLLQSRDSKLAANKKIAYEFVRQVLATRNVGLAPKYLAEGYIQHNPNVPTGRQAFMDFFGKMEKVPLKTSVDDLVTIIAERDLVILAFRHTLPEPKQPGATYTSTWFDMFRIENGLIVEHWDYGTKR